MKPSRLAWEYVVAQNNNNFRLNGLNPLAYLGVNPVTPVPFFSKATDPTSTDYANFILGTIWLNTANENIWMLVALTNFQGTWVKLGTSSGNLETLTGNSGGVVSPMVPLILMLLGMEQLLQLLVIRLLTRLPLARLEQA